MTEDIYKGIREGFKSVEEALEHDKRGGDFVFAEELHVKSSKEHQENALVIFKLQGSLDEDRRFKAVKVSRDAVKQFLSEIDVYRN